MRPRSARGIDANVGGEKEAWRKTKPGHISLTSFRTQICPSSFRKLASMKKEALARKYFSKVRGLCGALLALTENIGASKWKPRSVWRACQDSPSIATKTNQNASANSSDRFYRSGAEHCQNLQQWDQNICNARRLLHHKIQGNFPATRLKRTTAAKSKIWLGWPNMRYWPQHLNFAVFFATQGCRISAKFLTAEFLYQHK